MPDHETRNCGYFTSDRESTHGDPSFLEVVLPVRGDESEKYDRLLCTLKDMVDAINDLYGQVNP